MQVPCNVFNIGKLSNRRNKTWFNSNLNYLTLQRSSTMYIYICITICLWLLYMRTWFPTSHVVVSWFVFS